MEFGQRVKQLRRAKHLTKEDFCEDETELSVRQLTRIESGLSLPTLAKVVFIAKRLGVTVGDLADEERFELPERYKELKFLLLRTQTYMDPQRLSIRENYFDEIFDCFYDDLPEDEQLIVEILQSRLELFTTDTSYSARKIIQEYWEQTKQKCNYNINDLVLVDLYFPYIRAHNFDPSVFNLTEHKAIVNRLLEQHQQLPSKELFFLIKTLISAFANSLILKQEDDLIKIIKVFEDIVQYTQDFQKMAILYLLKWKYTLLIEKDFTAAKKHYQNALIFTELVSDNYLINQITNEWTNDSENFIQKGTL